MRLKLFYSAAVLLTALVFTSCNAIDTVHSNANKSSNTPVSPQTTYADGARRITIDELETLIKEGKAYINIHTVTNGNGEIRGNFILANGSSTFTPPPAPTVPAADHASASAASRFLSQATFGPSPNGIRRSSSCARRTGCSRIGCGPNGPD